MAKRRLLTGSDLVRILYGFEINSVLDAQCLALVLFRAEILLEQYFQNYKGGGNLRELFPHWFNLLKQLSSTKWATNWSALHPIESTEVSIALINWEGQSNILITEQIASAAKTATRN
jgi:hypothetical protein